MLCLSTQSMLPSQRLTLLYKRSILLSECLKLASIDLIDPLCSWNNQEKSCEVREIDDNNSLTHN